tara:strand:- start:479 stop:1210 length:732 start_codon:yes stop_codon:yes gene_type:complete
MKIDWQQLGLQSLTAVFILGCMACYLSSSIFGIEVLDGECSLQDTEGTDGGDLNATNKIFYQITIGIGCAPLILLVMYLFMKYGCAGNNMTFAGIISVLICGMCLGVSYTDDMTVRYGMIGLVSGIVILAGTMGTNQPTNWKMYMQRLSAVGVVLFSGTIATSSLGIQKFNDCQSERGCVEDNNGDISLCDSTCDDPPQSVPCSPCKACDINTNVVDKLWAVNATSITMLVLCICGIIASIVA